MWKILVGFVLFAALAIFVLMKSGGDVDLGGEKHDVAPPSAMPNATPAATAASSAASTPKQ